MYTKTKVADEVHMSDYIIMHAFPPGIGIPIWEWICAFALHVMLVHACTYGVRHKLEKEKIEQQKLIATTHRHSLMPLAPSSLGLSHFVSVSLCLSLCVCPIVILFVSFSPCKRERLRERRGAGSEGVSCQAFVTLSFCLFKLLSSWAFDVQS